MPDAVDSGPDDAAAAAADQYEKTWRKVCRDRDYGRSCNHCCEACGAEAVRIMLKGPVYASAAAGVA